MRILQVITSLQFGGAEKLISEIAPLLRDKGNLVDVCSFVATEPNMNKVLEAQGIKVINFAAGGSVYNPVFIFKLWRLMRRYDIVHTHNTAPQLFAAIGSVLCSVVLVTTEHNTSNRRRNWRWYAALDRWMYKRYDKVICISDQAEKNLLECHPSLKNVCTIYNGVNISRFRNAKPIECLKKEGVTVVTMVAGFRYQKDQDTLIKAIAKLDKSRYELWLIGDGERRAELETLAAETQEISNSGTQEQNDTKSIRAVKFFGIRTDVPELLKTADIIVMSSHFEGLSLSNVEGMSAGKPFIASDVDGLREVTMGYGILFPHGDAEALASEIRKLTEDRTYYQQVADKCWERAQMFDIQRMVDGYEWVYEEVLEGTSESRNP